MLLDMNRLPTVISCCFCCFLRAGTVMISIFSFIGGLLFAPNVAAAKGFWNLDPLLSYYSAATEVSIQITIGVVSIMLCVASVFLLIGAICNMPILILVYQWIAFIYSCIIFILFFVLALFCFFVHSNCILAGVVLCFLMVFEVLLTVYFLIVSNSLRQTLVLISGSNSML
ncbi:uncharacterized protein LOC112058125 [Bicyclus anynana]|uniref:Uncharacterized protein LOC112058125 n=1 Tax=Bicyclus anynana TaxID=110368 RepID=A0A6J1P9V9_BICAN|nr:uncharacterized protein LOC112058125 [Bicyclus anynana]